MLRMTFVADHNVGLMPMSPNPLALHPLALHPLAMHPLAMHPLAMHPLAMPVYRVTAGAATGRLCI